MRKNTIESVQTLFENILDGRKLKNIDKILSTFPEFTMFYNRAFQPDVMTNKKELRKYFTSLFKRCENFRYTIIGVAKIGNEESFLIYWTAEYNRVKQKDSVFIIESSHISVKDGLIAFYKSISEKQSHKI